MTSDREAIRKFLKNALKSEELAKEGYVIDWIGEDTFKIRALNGEEEITGCIFDVLPAKGG